MTKSGLIFGAVTLLAAGLTGVISLQICAPCLALFLGLGAGYLAGVFDKPADNNRAARLRSNRSARAF